MVRPNLDQQLINNGYYAEGERVVGHRHGCLAFRLGITEGQAIHPGDRVFRALLKHVNPSTNQKFTQQNVENSIRFFDF